ncbi:MAG TPA: class I SAM-dependent methyltransferase [Lapillicoccus sp.]
MDATGWDRRYDASDLVWSATPNAVVAREAADLPPGRALDLASGEGRNAIWLAERGWRVTAVDFSAVATARARRLAQERLGAAATRVEAVTADLMTWSPPPAGADLAVLAYLQLSVGERRHVHRLAAAALASGGTFLLVAHHRDNLTEGVGGPQDPAVLFTPDEVVADLDGTGLLVDRADRVERVVAAEGVDAHQADAPAHAVALDVLVRAHRASR